MLNLVVTNCFAMLCNHRKAIHLQGIEHRIVKYNHPRISSGNTYIPINPTHFIVIVITRLLMHQPAPGPYYNYYPK